MTEATQSAIPERLRPLLERTAQDPRPVVLATCGIAGAGKTTLAKAVLAAHPQFVRLSGDEMIAARHGLYGVDYPASAAVYAAHQHEADGLYLAAFRGQLACGADVVLDRSFYARADRDAFRALVAAAGARWLLVFLRPADPELLWHRIRARAAGVKDPNSALDIDRDTFDDYCRGFEDPCGEGEIVIDVT